MRAALQLLSPKSIRALVAPVVGATMLLASVGAALAEEVEAPPAPYDLSSMECGELDKEAGLRPLRAAHIAGEDLDLLCKVTVGLSDKVKGSPKSHTVKLTVSHAGKTSYEQVRDARVLTTGNRTVLFVIPAEKLPTEAGKVTVRAELSKPASKPGLKEISYELTAED